MNYFLFIYSTVTDFARFLGLSLIHICALDQLDKISQDSSLVFEQVRADISGVVSYGIDSYESLQPSDVEADSFNKANYVKNIHKSGDLIESGTPAYKLSLIHILEHGARVTAKGNVIILGELKGSVTAGAAGNDQAVILAFSMSPLQLRIADHTSRFNEKNRRLGKGTMMASVEEGELKVFPLKKPFLSSLLDI